MYRRYGVYENQTVAGQGEGVGSNLSCHNKVLLAGHHKDTIGWDSKVSACSCSAAPPGLCWGGEMDPASILGAERVQHTVHAMSSLTGNSAYLQFSLSVFMWLNDEATVVIICKLSLLGIWINYPWVEKFRLLKAFFLHSLFHVALFSLELD